ncbi:type ISP restriction/modification enzyme [Luteimonas notoginsengisoli]|uniref:site-specific DNA-methyltransferase (adenine-specific) n=1 Tax=Luteimonas notoginsengisoli TaxID=1578200 RepID=A0ABV7UQ74_9GAMM
MSKLEAMRNYLASVEQALKTGQAGEHTHRPALEALLEALGGPAVDAINEPRQIKCGAPDFIIVRGTVPLGHVEAKDVGLDLVKLERGEQLTRYRESLGNLVFTDYLSFRWYLDGELRLTADLPRPAANGRIRWSDDAAAATMQLLDQFLLADIPLKSTPQDLAIRMAGLGKLIRSLIGQTFKAEGEQGELHGQLQAFRKVLIESLTVEQFADMYAQTLCYGLFAARCNALAKGFTRQIAASALPKTNPFLRKLFNSIAGPDLDERIAWAVDQLAELLARADMTAILSDFGKRTRQEDPVVHFYETFLAAYDPKMREARGVYYTPEPVVGYIVRSVDVVLKRDFGMKEGLAHAKKIKLKRPKVHGKGEETYETHRLQILDPATGTGTFLYAVIAKIREHFDGNAGAWPGYVAEHLLPRLFGFELLMAPYAVAHMKLGLELEQSGYDFASDQRLGVFLTNSLEEAHELTGLPLFTQWLAEESRAAANVKRDAPVMVVLGNPPYSAASANTGAWIANLLRGRDIISSEKTESYFHVDGKPLGERNPRWINDDYVKFIRFAQWRIEKTGYGIIAFVTNHGYLNNPTFRGMRESLMRCFDEIYLLDLHGNSKKKEKTPQGGKDDNVFDIQQGVAIGIFVRRESANPIEGRLAKVFHGDMYGTRAEKYALLDESDIGSTQWRELAPVSPSYFFVPEDADLRLEYAPGWSVLDVMPVSNVGIITKRDALTIDMDKIKLWDRVVDFSHLPELEARHKYDLPEDVRDWSIERAQKDLRESGPVAERIIEVCYRPFDNRFMYYTGNARGFVGWPVEKVTRHFLSGPNVGLVTARSNKSQSVDHFFAVANMPETKCGERTTQSCVFPLWLYKKQASDLLGSDEVQRVANVGRDFVAALSMVIGIDPAPEDTLAWIYAVLYTPTYRSRYADFLRSDFPRIPLPPGRDIFDRFVSIGRELIALHTMEQKQPRISRFDVTGSNEVVKVRWAPGNGGKGRVYINDAQHFDGVPQCVWDTHIGGYRVAEKWLKGRKGRQLSFEDVMHYHEIVAALARTLELQVELDALVDNLGGWPLGKVKQQAVGSQAL